MTSAAPLVLSWIVVLAALFAVVRSRSRARAPRRATVVEGRIVIDGDLALRVVVRSDPSIGRETARTVTAPAFAVVKSDGTRVAVRVEGAGEQLVLRAPLGPALADDDRVHHSPETRVAEIRSGETVVVEAELPGVAIEPGYRSPWWPSAAGRVVVSRPHERARERRWTLGAFALLALGFASMLAIPWWITRDWLRAYAFAGLGVSYFVIVGTVLRSTRPWWLASRA